MNGVFKRTAFVEIENFCNILNVFNVTFELLLFFLNDADPKREIFFFRTVQQLLAIFVHPQL